MLALCRGADQHAGCASSSSAHWKSAIDSSLSRCVEKENRFNDSSSVCRGSKRADSSSVYGVVVIQEALLECLSEAEVRYVAHGVVQRRHGKCKRVRHGLKLYPEMLMRWWFVTVFVKVV